MNKILVRMMIAAVTVATGLLASAVERSYTGATKGDWSVASNWTPAGVPGPDDAVTISGKAVSVSGLSSVTVASLALEAGATLTVTAEPSASPTLTDLYANATVFTVTGLLKVSDGATLAPVCDPVTGAAVFFKTGSFTLEAGGRVNADHAGYNWQNSTAPEGATKSGSFWTWAPGPSSAYGTGASHGGKASSGAKTLYGYQYAPYFAGSPAYWNGAATFAPGGGVVVIHASGAMTLNGVVSANADWSGDKTYCAPAGGSVWLAGATLAVSAAARVTAVGGSTMNGAAGGGGRVSLAVGLTSDDLASLSDGSTPGSFTYTTGVAGFYCTAAGGFKSNVRPTRGDAGTVTLVTKGSAAPVVTPVTPVVPPADPEPCAGTSKRYVGADDGDWFVATNWEPEGVPCVNDDVTVRGHRVIAARGITAKTLTLTGASTLHVKAVTVSAESDYDLFVGATKLYVKDALTVEDGSVLKPENDPDSGAPVMIDVGSFTLSADSSVDATALGWKWIEWDQTQPPPARLNFIGRFVRTQACYTQAQSAGVDHPNAPGYGGEAYQKSGAFGRAYGNRLAPFLPGAPGSTYNNSGAARGGGTVLLKCRGMATVNGAVLANGEPYSSYTGSTGGGIWLVSRNWKFGADARIEAKGVGLNWHTYGPGGGRISIGASLTDEDMDDLAKGTLPSRVDEGAIEGVAYDVSGGVCGKGSGNPGTAVMLSGVASDVVVSVQGTPETTVDCDPSGEFICAQGESRTFYAASDKGSYGVSADGLRRYRCGGYVVSNKLDEVVATGIASSFSLQLEGERLYVDWQWTDLSYGTRVAKPEGGSVLYAGETYTNAFTVWQASGETIELTAVPSNGMRFVCWAGGVPLDQREQKTVTLTEWTGRNVQALFEATLDDLTPKTFVGAPGAAWNDPDNWDPAGLPDVTSDVIITGEVSLAGLSTVNLGRLTVTNGARLTVTAQPASSSQIATLWDEKTVVNVTGSLKVMSGATLAPVCDPVTGAAVLFRVGSFVLDEGGRVSADHAGYDWQTGTAPSGAAKAGSLWTWSPAGSTTDTGGAWHGGAGTESGKTAYGNKYAPVLAGSAACRSSTGKHAPGGGVVAIHATGYMVLNGVVSANADWAAEQERGAPAGGSVWLAGLSVTVGAQARLTAVGASSVASAGGGGRVSLAVGVTTAELSDLAAGTVPASCECFDAIDGFFCSAGGGYRDGANAIAKDGGDGSVTLVSARGSRPTVVPVPTPTPVEPEVREGVAKSYVGEDGGSWLVAENWDPVGVPLTNDAVTVENRQVVVEGPVGVRTLTLRGTAVLEAKAVRANAVESEGLFTNATVISVSGLMTVADTAKVLPTCDPDSGAPVLFRVGQLSLAAGASFDATGRGWNWVVWDQTQPLSPSAKFVSRLGRESALFCSAPSVGFSHTVAPGYGGAAKLTSGRYGLTYGNALAPFLPGGPSSTYGNSFSPAGGSVLVICAGEAAIDGQVRADGSVTATAGDGKYVGSTGGGIWLCARKFTFGPQAFLSAQGVGKGNYTYGPGGGRIALLSGGSEEEIASLARGEQPSSVTVDEITSVGYSVDGGKGAASGGVATANQGDPGTARMLFGSLGETQVRVAGYPRTTADSEPAGVISYAQGETVTFYAATNHGNYGVTADGTSRFRCAGYVVSNTVQQVAAGAESSFALTIGSDPLVVTWLWTDEERGVTIDVPDGATVLVNGVAKSGRVSLWHASASDQTLTAVPASGDEFLYWVGDVPYGRSFDNPLTLTESKVRGLLPVFRAAEAATTRTWRGGTGSWLDPAKWNPTGLPGTDDNVVVTAGKIACSNAVAMGSLTISGSAEMTLCGTTAESVQLRVVRDIVMTGTAVLNVGTERQRANGLVSIGGDLRLEGYGLDGTSKPTGNRFVFEPGPLNRGFTHATGTGFVEIGGTCHVTNLCQVIPDCDEYDGGSAVFRINRLKLDEGGYVNAARKGYGYDYDRLPPTIAPGAGYGYEWAPSHAGKGYLKDNTYTNETYGQAYAPIEPGSPTGINGTYARGGGLVRIIARRMDIDGVVSAEGGYNYDGSSGGGIWLAARRFTFGPTAKLLANAPNATDFAGGGGGRIALIERASEAQLKELAETGTLSNMWLVPKMDEAAFEEKWGADIVNVKGGMQGAPQQGGDGTFVFLDGAIGGLMILVK